MGEIHETCDSLLIPIHATVDKSVIKVKSTQGLLTYSNFHTQLFIQRKLMDNRNGGINFFLSSSYSHF